MNRCGFTIYDMIVRNARLYPEQCAVVYGDRRISFSAYQDLCDRCAAGLAGEGIKVGDRIALLAANNDDFMVLCGAAAKTGAVIVSVNYRLSEAEAEYVFKDTSPKYLFTSGEYKDQARRSASAAGSVRRHFVFKADEQEDEFLPFGTLLSKATVTRQNAIPDNHPYMIIHTAAVGGKPRGCTLSQTNLLAVALQISEMFKLTASDCYLGALPLFHIGGFSMTLAAMLQGGKNLIMDRFDPSLILTLAETEKGTFFVTFPPMLGAILDAQEKHAVGMKSLRFAAGIDGPDTIRRFLKNNPRAAFHGLYGQTEAMPVSSCDVREKPGSVGRPALMTRVAIFDDSDCEVEAGVQGEICVRSPAVFLGYWNLPADTAYTFRNGWHHTGDRGHVDKDGFLFYGGRKPEKELIKPGGENVYPAEVEKTILSHVSVEEVCVIGVPDPEWGEAVKAVCVLTKGMEMTAEELIDFVAGKIARYKKPKHVLFVSSLPKTAGGEINRTEVKKLYSGKS
ncbi:MAG TPA: AMP-binding protein [Syntrophales bacterium]|nr:AMP-binding protein [Syntrophales bacterium]